VIDARAVLREVAEMVERAKRAATDGG